MFEQPNYSTRGGDLWPEAASLAYPPNTNPTQPNYNNPMAQRDSHPLHSASSNYFYNFHAGYPSLPTRALPQPPYQPGPIDGASRGFQSITAYRSVPRTQSCYAVNDNGHIDQSMIDPMLRSDEPTDNAGHNMARPSAHAQEINGTLPSLQQSIIAPAPSVIAPNPAASDNNDDVAFISCNLKVRQTSNVTEAAPSTKKPKGKRRQAQSYDANVSTSKSSIAKRAEDTILVESHSDSEGDQLAPRETNPNAHALRKMLTEPLPWTRQHVAKIHLGIHRYYRHRSPSGQPVLDDDVEALLVLREEELRGGQLANHPPGSNANTVGTVNSIITNSPTSAGSMAASVNVAPSNPAMMASNPIGPGPNLLYRSYAEAMREDVSRIQLEVPDVDDHAAVQANSIFWVTRIKQALLNTEYDPQIPAPGPHTEEQKQRWDKLLRAASVVVQERLQADDGEKLAEQRAWSIYHACLEIHTSGFQIPKIKFILNLIEKCSQRLDTVIYTLLNNPLSRKDIIFRAPEKDLQLIYNSHEVVSHKVRDMKSNLQRDVKALEMKAKASMSSVAATSALAAPNSISANFPVWGRGGNIDGSTPGGPSTTTSHDKGKKRARQETVPVYDEGLDKTHDDETPAARLDNNDIADDWDGVGEHAPRRSKRPRIGQ